jgi:RiboL-PSP-HEPN
VAELERQNETTLSGVPAERLAEFQESVRKKMEPYAAHIKEGLVRLGNLLQAAKAISENAAPGFEDRQTVVYDIFRSVVVLSHAYLEDYLRTLAKVFLPLAGEEILNAVPLVGMAKGNREPPKFALGKLAGHRGKLVDDLIKESVDEHLARRTFNSEDEIVAFLQELGLMPDSREHLSEIGAMIRRRHLIVHRADRKEGQLQSINHEEVLQWITATRLFMESLFVPIASKRYTPQFLKEKFNITLIEP